MWIGHRKEIRNLTFRALVRRRRSQSDSKEIRKLTFWGLALWIRPDEGLMLETSTFQSLPWPIHISSPVDKTKLSCYTPHGRTEYYDFFRNLPFRSKIHPVPPFPWWNRPRFSPRAKVCPDPCKRGLKQRKSHHEGARLTACAHYTKRSFIANEEKISGPKLFIKITDHFTSMQNVIHRRNRDTTRRPIPRTPSWRRKWKICGSTESRKTLEQKYLFQIGTLNPHGNLSCCF